jgi:hypothetical protein
MLIQLRLMNKSTVMRSCLIERSEIKGAIHTLKWAFEHHESNQRGCVNAVADYLITVYDAEGSRFTHYLAKCDVFMDITLSPFSWSIKVYDKNSKWANEPVFANLDLIGETEIYRDSYRVSWLDRKSNTRIFSDEMSQQDAENLRMTILTKYEACNVRVSKTKRRK